MQQGCMTPWLQHEDLISAQGRLGHDSAHPNNHAGHEAALSSMAELLQALERCEQHPTPPAHYEPWLHQSTELAASPDPPLQHLLSSNLGHPRFLSKNIMPIQDSRMHP